MTSALTPATVTPTNLGALIEAQGETLAATVDQAAEVFKKNQAEQKKTIDAQSKLIEELQAILIKERGEKEELLRAHEAALSALKIKKEAQGAKATYDIDALFKVCDEISQLQTDLPSVHAIAFEKKILAEYGGPGTTITIPATGDFAGGSIHHYIAHLTSKVQGRYDPKAEEDVLVNLTAETRKKIDAIKALLKSIKEEIKK